jgi:hypothetical protein
VSTYSELKCIIEGQGITCSALTMPDSMDTYAVIRMPTHQAEQSGDDRPTLYGAYMQVDLFTTGDADAKARSIVNAALFAGFVYRGRSDDYLNDRQHVTIRLMKLEGI